MKKKPENFFHFVFKLMISNTYNKIENQEYDICLIIFNNIFIIIGDLFFFKIFYNAPVKM